MEADFSPRRGEHKTGRVETGRERTVASVPPAPLFSGHGSLLSHNGDSASQRFWGKLREDAQGMRTVIIMSVSETLRGKRILAPGQQRELNAVFCWGPLRV